MTHTEKQHRIIKIAAELDAGKNPAQVALDWGVGLSTILMAKKNAEFAEKRLKNHEEFLTNLKEACLAGKTLGEMSAMFDYTKVKISNFLVFLGLKARRKRLNPLDFQHVARPEDVAKIDWSMRDIDISHILGVSRERVRQLRLKLKHPKSKDHRVSKQFINFRAWTNKNRDAIQNMSLTDIATLAGISNTSNLSKWCKNLGIVTSSKRVPEKITLDWLKNHSVPDGDCWLMRSPNQYPCIGRGGRNGNSRRAQVRVYQDLIGSVKSGTWVVNSCGNMRCVNPDHLEAVDPKTAVGMAEAKGTRHKPKLPSETVLEIRLRRARGDHLTLLARDYKLSVTSVLKLCKNRTYKNVNGQHHE